MGGDGTTVARSLGHRPALDGLRGVAVALVVLVHSGNSLWRDARPWLARGGPLGVHLFFVLSGFLITTLLLTEHQRRGTIDLPAFFRRRALRLVPALVALVAVLLVVAATGTRLEVRSVLAEAAYVLTFTSNISTMGDPVPLVTRLVGEGHSPVTEVGHTWSLGIEAQFYILWALGLWAMTRARWSSTRLFAVTAALVVAVALWRSYQMADGVWWLRLYFGTATRLDAPLVGALAGIAFCAGWLERAPARAAVWAGAVGLGAFLLAAFTVGFEAPSLYHGLYTVLAVAAAVSIAGVLRGPSSLLSGALSWRPLRFLGTISYSVYLWHYGLFWAFERRDPDWPGPVRLVLGVGAALLLGWLSYRLVERPFLRRKDRRPASPVPEPLPAAAR